MLARKRQAQILDMMKAREMRLEINPHFAVAKGTLDAVYPSCFITQMALEIGVEFCYGSDAHVPEQAGILLTELQEHLLYGLALR